MGEERLNPELAALEAALAELAPTPSGTSRDRLMFLAGQAGASPQPQRRTLSWGWTLSLSANVLLAVTLGTLAMRNVARPVEQVAHAPTPGVALEALQTQPPATLAATSYGRLRRLMLEQGVEGLAPPTTAPAGENVHPLPKTHLRQWLKELGQS